MHESQGVPRTNPPAKDGQLPFLTFQSKLGWVGFSSDFAKNCGTKANCATKPRREGTWKPTTRRRTTREEHIGATTMKLTFASAAAVLVTMGLSSAHAQWGYGGYPGYGNNYFSSVGTPESSVQHGFADIVRS